MIVKVKIKEKEETLFIYWQYVQKKKKSPVTKCFIKDAANNILGTGRTYVHRGDTFVKNRGRIISLTKALTIFPDLDNKDIRTAVWKAYNNMINGKWN